ncbi:arginine decarboxylase [bacterium SCSIO 12741]|nr:arginine decarboxylase [bacterium SCSIO 12741]
MKTKYIDLVENTFDFPQKEFQLDDDQLVFHGIPLMDLIKQYGTPLKFTYLPKISENINQAKIWFNVSMAKHQYEGRYFYCYCTKSNHFRHVLEEVLNNDVHLETSSAFDINLIESLYEAGKVSKLHYVLCNGYKMPEYAEGIARLIRLGFKNVIPILDNIRELDQLDREIDQPFEVGIRIASEEEPKFEFYTSRLGIRYKDIERLYLEEIKPNPKVKLKMLHFFINTGIKDSAYYWNELSKCLDVYVKLKKNCPELTALNIGGGFPIKTSLNFQYDYQYIIDEIIGHVKFTCDRAGIPVPDIFTEFGSFTVGEAGGAIYEVVHQKRQNDRENWNMINSSFMTTLPDTWAINSRFLMLPVNRWKDEYERVLLGGLSCDSDDYYNSEQHVNAIYLPRYEEENPLYIGFFGTGAYQESVGGFGGVQHCLIPSPRQIIIERLEDGKAHFKLFSKEQSYKSMLKPLGY